VIFCVPYLAPFGGTPVAGLIVLHPGVQFKPVEGNALATDGDSGDVVTDLSIESIAVHTEVKGGVTQANESRLQCRRG
jgi:hypothetical protein